MTWEEYRPAVRGVNRCLSGVVSIATKSATIAADVCEEYLQKNGHKHVMPMYNQDTMQAALKPGKEGYKVRFNESGSGNLQIKRFIEDLRIKPGRYPLSWNRKLGALVFKPEHEEDQQ